MARTLVPPKSSERAFLRMASPRSQRSEPPGSETINYVHVTKNTLLISMLLLLLLLFLLLLVLVLVVGVVVVVVVLQLSQEILSTHLPAVLLILPQYLSQARDGLVIGHLAFIDRVLITLMHQCQKFISYIYIYILYSNYLKLQIVENIFLHALRASDGCPGPEVHLTLSNLQNP